MSTRPQLSYEEIERMRSLVLEADRQKNPNQFFDPNNPPKVKYVHQDFPKLVYNHEMSKPSTEKEVLRQGTPHIEHVPAKYVTKQVNDEKELKAALKAGWKEEPPAFNQVHMSLNPEEQPEVIDEPEEEAEQN